ncbi:MAG TPA: adenylate/guanylate cyclase domain-containing protein [Spirochaetota bacterium]|nr:hypothetical protein [Spirochaetota bacterium]HQO39601.1 adenylate/guanylate cyclase domain-containing protein [Spirochaetota bacterium]
MKSEFRIEQRLKLREVIDRVAIDLGIEAGKIVKKKSVFTYFLLFRLMAVIILPLVMGSYIVIGRYVDSGFAGVPVYSIMLFAVSLVNCLVIIFIFSRRTSELGNLINCLVDRREYDSSHIINAYRESFSIPASLTRWEFMLSVLFILIPAVAAYYSGFRPAHTGLREIVIGWWIGTLSLILISYIFYQYWVEAALTRLYDYGIRISPDSGISRDANIYLRTGLFTFSIIVTIILIYANMLYMLAVKVHPDPAHYMLQVVVMSVIILVPVFFFFLMLFRSIKRSFDILASKMKIVEDGDYSVRFLNNRDDQIGRLYDNFDYLVSTLNNVLSGLENEVSKRTAKLEEVTSKISKYVSPQLYSKIYSDDTGLELSYARKKLTVFFSDIVGFTETSENLAPEDLSHILNQYLDAMADIALKWGGTIDKYIGDAVMIFFGDPEFTDDRDHALRCAGMAIEMLGRLEQLQLQWKSAGITFPLHIRIGINTGYCTVGNFGSASRMDYTVIGSAVNLASRLESAAQPDSILVSEATCLLVNDIFECQPAGELMLKGIDHPVRAWRLKGKSEERKVSAVHLQGLDLSIDMSLMKGEAREKARRALKDIYDSLL